MMDLMTVAKILKHVQAPRNVVVGIPGEGRLYIQIREDEGNGRKYWLSDHMTPSEVVRTAFMACLAYEEHELREAFLYKGAAIFGPHLDIEALAHCSHHQDRRHGSPGAWERET